MTTFTEVLAYVSEQATDAEANSLFRVGNARIKQLRTVKAAELSATLKAGDKITTHSLKPKYLNGIVATVVAIEGDRIRVRADLPHQLGRYGTLDGHVTLSLRAVSKV